MTPATEGRRGASGRAAARAGARGPVDDRPSPIGIPPIEEPGLKPKLLKLWRHLRQDNRFAIGAGVGLAVGLIMGYLAHGGGNGDQASTSATKATIEPAAPATSGQSLYVTLGPPHANGYIIIFPVVIQNGTGRDLEYAQADCAFYSKENILLASGVTSTANLPAGSSGSSEMTVQGVGPDQIDHYNCRAHTN